MLVLLTESTYSQHLSHKAESAKQAASLAIQSQAGEEVDDSLRSRGAPRIHLVGIDEKALMDTGSNVTTISEELFRSQFRDRIYLYPTCLYFRLRSVNSEELPMFGYLVDDLTVRG